MGQLGLFGENDLYMRLSLSGYIISSVRNEPSNSEIKVNSNLRLFSHPLSQLCICLFF